MDVLENLDHEYTDGSVYQGSLLCGKRHGLGILTCSNSTQFVGHFVNGLPHGLGALTMKTGVEYYGFFVRGRFHGLGMFVHKNGWSFKGQFKEGRAEGYGIYVTKNSRIFCQGLFENGKLVSQADCVETGKQVEAVVEQTYNLVKSVDPQQESQ